MPRLLTCGLLLALATVLPACDSGAEMSPDGISGTWRGTVDRQGTEYTVVVDLRQSETSQASALVTGDGELSTEAEPFAFSVDNGSFVPSSNDVSLPQQYDAARPGRMNGTVADDLTTMTVTIIGGPADFNGEEFTLSRDG
ncbi:MAG: hypothetical protein V5A48_10335 [Salinivenus sp.]